MKELFTLNPYFWKYRRRLFWGIVFVLLSNYFRVLQPQEIRKALDFVIEKLKTVNASGGNIDEALTKEISSGLFYFGGMVILLALLMGIFMYFMRQTLIVMSRMMEYDLRNTIFEHYEKLNLSFYKKNNTGDLMARATEDVNKVRMYLGPAILYSVNLVGSFIAVLISMISVSPTLTFWALIPLPFLSVSIYYVSRLINKRSEKVQKQLSKLNVIAQENFSGVRVIKAYSREAQMGEHFAKESEEFKNRNVSLARVSSLFYPIMLLLIGVSTVLTVFVGGLLVIEGKATPGMIAEFVIYINMLTWPFTAIGWIASIIQTASVSMKRINQYLNTEPEIIYQNTDSTPEAIHGDVVFENVSFTYPDSGITALKNINFHIKKGETVAIIGRTGSGKTTIADLLCRMYDVSSGSIYIDNKNIKTHNLAYLRQSIGYVPQDVFLFSDTVKSNIVFGRRSTVQDDVEKYAAYSSIHNEILDLPKGYDTVIGERGVTLSGGQKQRISIARALLKKPQILILDDCLSAVDAHTEQQIATGLKEVCKDSTSFVITHRIYNALKFDKIIVINDGEVSEFGTPEQLYQNQGYYYEMVERGKVEA